MDYWDQLWIGIERLADALKRSKAVLIKRPDLRAQAREVVQAYFRQVRPGLAQLLGDAEIQGLDAIFRGLIGLSAGNASRDEYLRLIRDAGKLRVSIEPKREQALGLRGSEGLSSLERNLLDTLAAVVPTAALSYRQALIDLTDQTRESWRGTASELRETLREVLDYLAPDAQVLATEGFKLEQGQSRPTMRQKVRHILRLRRAPSGALAAPEDAARLVDEIVGSMARSVYDRGSLETHVSGSRDHARQLKQYVDVVLSDVLALR